MCSLDTLFGTFWFILLNIFLFFGFCFCTDPYDDQGDNTDYRPYRNRLHDCFFFSIFFIIKTNNNNFK